jgi:putative methyltransferase
MSLYYDAQNILDSKNARGLLRARVYNDKNLNCPPSQVYALLIEATKWSSILTEVIDRAQLLSAEKRV